MQRGGGGADQQPVRGVDFGGLFRLFVAQMRRPPAICFFVTAVILCRAEPSEVESRAAGESVAGEPGKSNLVLPAALSTPL